MPRYAYQKPVNRLYSYNTNYMTNYYKPLTHYIETEKSKELVPREKRAPSEQPGHQSLAERLKTFPMDGTVFRARAASVPPSRRLLFEDDGDIVHMASQAYRAETPGTASSAGRRVRARPMSTYEPSVAYESLMLDDEPRRVPLWMKHPYRLPEEDIVVPPHESSIWPESVPHFNLVSSYDTMIGYLGLKNPVHR